MRITKRTRHTGFCSGFTAIEFLVALGIGFLSMTGAAALSVFTARSFAAIGDYIDLDSSSRNALDRMGQIVREADGVTEYDPHRVGLSYRGGEVFFVYSTNLKTLRLIQTNGSSKVLLSDCKLLDFQVFQRNSVAGTYDQFPAISDLSVAKILEVSWICAREPSGTPFGADSVQSAKFVIRKP
jgi:hypothetical protein